MAFPEILHQPLVSFGGGYIRVWRPGKGLSVELPCCLVVNKETGSIDALGEEAAELEGKLPPTLKFVRPFWCDRIVDRGALRALLQEALQRDRQMQKDTPAAWFHRYTVRVPESMPDLHRRWLLTTCREVWPIPWKEQGAFASLQTRPGARSEVGLYLDVGFSGVHVALMVGKNVIATQSRKDLSFQQFCTKITTAVRVKQHTRFAPSSLYSQQWFTQHAGFQEKEQQPQVFTVSRALFDQEIQLWADRLADVVEHSMSLAPAEVRAQLSRVGVSLVGGGAEISELVTTLEKKLGLPITVVRQPKYATLREKGA